LKVSIFQEKGALAGIESAQSAIKNVANPAAAPITSPAK
jgi:hypothetical protein